MFISVVTIVHIFISCVLVGIILLQQGKGADVGAAFGGGGSASLFGAGGADNFLLRATTVCAGIFMVTSITLALQSKLHVEEGGRLFRDAPATVVVPETTTPSAADGSAKDGAAPLVDTAPEGSTEGRVSSQAPLTPEKSVTSEQAVSSQGTGANPSDASAPAQPVGQAPAETSPAVKSE